MLCSRSIPSTTSVKEDSVVLWLTSHDIAQSNYRAQLKSNGCYSSLSFRAYCGSKWPGLIVEGAWVFFSPSFLHYTRLALLEVSWQCPNFKCRSLDILSGWLFTRTNKIWVELKTLATQTDAECRKVMLSDAKWSWVTQKPEPASSWSRSSSGARSSELRFRGRTAAGTRTSSGTSPASRRWAENTFPIWDWYFLVVLVSFF